MTPKEAARLLFLLVVGAVVAVTFRPATSARDRHDPIHFERFERARARLPILGAVRVRSDDGAAAARLANAPHRGDRQVVRPDRIRSLFERGRLLYADTPQLEQIRAALDEGRLPKTLPEGFDPEPFIHDPRGPYACDVILDGVDGLAWIREYVPDARLSGEWVLAERERAESAEFARALLAVLLVAAATAYAARRTLAAVETALLSALLPLAALSLLGWGIDAGTILAVGVVALAPRRLPLAAAAVGCLFPSLALKRIGLVFLLGVLVRPRMPAPGLGGDARKFLWGALPAVVLLAAALWAPLQPVELPPDLGREPAYLICAPGRVAERAAGLRALGAGEVVGDRSIVPPEPDLEKRRLLTWIFHRADVLSRSGQNRDLFLEIRNAAALEGLYVPKDLRAYRHTKDGDRALRIQGDVDQSILAGEPDVQSSVLYRLRGEAGVQRQSRAAAGLAYLLGSLFLWLRLQQQARRAQIASVFGLAAGLCVLAISGPIGPVALVLVGAVLAPTIGVAAPLLAAAALAPQVLGAPALAVALSAVIAWIGRRPTSVSVELAPTPR
ncbi:MAG: hypothetical protein O7E54_06320 [Planctomycetota bacterium]|nr:hypothetical protein [Planctomycetota bacterium]